MSEDERRLLEKLYYRKGFSVSRIMKIDHFSAYSMSSLYKYLRGSRLKITTKRMETIYELKKKGHCVIEIANITGLSRRTIYNYIELENVQ